MQLAYRDHLTGLPNKLLFTDRLKQAIDRAVRAGRLEEVGGMLSIAAAAGSER